MLLLPWGILKVFIYVKVTFLLECKKMCLPKIFRFFPEKRKKGSEMWARNFEIKIPKHNENHFEASLVFAKSYLYLLSFIETHLSTD